MNQEERHHAALLRHEAAAACVLVLIFCAALTLLLPAARQSAQALCNRVYIASEAVNSYAYKHFPVPEGTGITLACVLIGTSLAALGTLAVVTPGPLAALLLAIAAALGQAYLGLSLPAWGNIALFALLALVIVCKKSGLHAAMPAAACMLAAALLTAALVPGTDVQVETASEHVRDLLGAALVQMDGSAADEPSPVMETRHENRRDTLAGEQAAQTSRDYRLVTVEEQQISLPHWIDYLRIALLCLLVPVLLAAPFVPFVWLNRRAQKTAQRLACLDDPDPAAAVRGIFLLVIGYLDAVQVGDSNALFSARLSGAQLPDAYAALYAECAALWQEAAYSGHNMTEAHRDKLLDLLTQTEQRYFDQADWRTRLKLRYVHCLHE